MRRSTRDRSQVGALSLDHRPRRSDRVLAQQVDGVTVLLLLDGGAYFSLNEVGSVVWDLCDGAHAVRDVVVEVRSRFDAPPEAVEADVLALVSQLVAEGLAAAAAA